jgi:hypothetical protein
MTERQKYNLMLQATSTWYGQPPDLVSSLFVRLAQHFGRGCDAHYIRPSKIFPGLRQARSQVRIDGQDTKRIPHAPWHRSVAERLISAYLRRMHRSRFPNNNFPLGFPAELLQRGALELFRDWFEDRTGYREVCDVETLLEASEGLGGHEFETCLDVARGLGWKVSTDAPNDRPLPWDWTCGNCGGHKMGTMLAGDLGVCSGCGSAWPIKK